MKRWLSLYHVKIWHAGLFLAGLAVHYTSEAKRYIPEALALYCRIMHAVVPPKAATLLLSSSKAAKSRGKQQSHVQPHSSSAPSSASQPMQQLYVHPLDSLDWTGLGSKEQNRASSVQPLSLTGCLGGGAADLAMPAFRCAILGRNSAEAACIKFLHQGIFSRVSRVSKHKRFAARLCLLSSAHGAHLSGLHMNVDYMSTSSASTLVGI